MTLELCVCVALALVAGVSHAADWWACRTPLGFANHGIAEARTRRRRGQP
jgi:hypothetical protein